jgi:hypothetical protein
MRKFKLIGLLLLTICILPFSALAGDFDGSKPLLCAVIETFDCGPGGECQRGTAESIDIPQFLKISFKEKTISSTPESGPVRTTKIKNMERIDGKLILQGVQNGKAWSMVISEATGKVTLSASDDQAGFLVFGACTPQ